jgi:hypothetical protein
MSRFRATVDAEGRLVPVVRERLWRQRGSEVWVSVHRGPCETRTGKSNSYLWGVVYRAICDETGNDPETVHEALKREARRVGILDPVYTVIGSSLFEDDPTTVVEQEQFSRYVDWIKEGCATGSLIGSVLVIPDPPDGDLARQEAGL